MPRIQSDLLTLLEATATQKLGTVSLSLDSRFAATVMLVSGGYPEDYNKGDEIFGLNEVSGSLVFHAGTKLDKGKVVSNGGRVIAVTSLDHDFKQAIKKSYQEIEKLSFDKMYYRTDIGFDL